MSSGGRVRNLHGVRWVLFVSWVALLLPQACGNSAREFSHASSGAAGDAGESSAAAGKPPVSGGSHAGGSGGRGDDTPTGGGVSGRSEMGGLGGADSLGGDGGEGGMVITPPPPENCPQLTDPANGVIDTREVSAGTKATYACNTGYKLSGTAARTCEHSAWSGTAPTCAIQDCGALTAPTDGSVAAPTTTYGATGTYSCKQGYGPSGSSTRTCQADGTWSGTTPTCVIANCPALAGPTGGTVDAPLLTYGATATYACNTGNKMIGTATRSCQPDGSWSGTAPTCAAVDCGTPKALPNGTATGTATTYNSVVTYACNAGYNFSGSTSSTCQASGMWSGTAPSCSIKDCGALTAPSNGTVSASTTTYGASATYACNTGYTLSSSTARTCGADGTWSGSAPTCGPKDCGALTAPSNGTISQPSTVVGATATYSCNTGYALNGTATRQCQTSVMWSGNAPTCTLKDCGTLTAPSNGSVSQPNTLVGGTATYSCNTNYNLSGTATRTCQNTGAWGGTAPTCVAKAGNGSTCSGANDCASGNCSTYATTGTSICCQASYANCGSCVNRQTDLNNCGACGNKCPLNRNCSSGACTCPGYTFPASCGGCGSWTFEANGNDGWVKDTNPDLIAGSNGAQNTGFTSTAANIHDGGGGLAVPINVDYQTTSIASVAVPFCQSGVTANMGGFTVSFWVKFAGATFDQSSEDVFLFVGAWSPAGSSRGPALFKNKMPTNTWINVSYTFPVSINADHISIELHPGAQWQGSMYIDSVLITGL